MKWKTNSLRDAVPPGEEDAQSGCWIDFQVALRKKCNYEYVRKKFSLADQHLNPLQK